MEPKNSNSWTLSSLIRAFLVLALSYILLCGSAFAFVVSKFLSLFGLLLPCPCKGIFGFKSSSICWHKLLIDLPMRIIQDVTELIWSYLMLQLDRTMRFRNECRESEEGESSSSSSIFPGPKTPRKKVVNKKPKPVFRPKIRNALDRGKSLSCDNSPSAVCSSSQVRYTRESLESESVRNNCFHGESNCPESMDVNDKRCSLDLSWSSGDNEGQDVGSFVVERLITNSEEKVTRGNEVDQVELLQEALRQETAARTALCQELEEERAEAATSIDEVMVMISQLQEEKSLLEMEARQYNRINESRIDYLVAEIDILKEILASKDLEIYSLEKKLEASRRMGNFDDQFDSDLS